MAANETDTPAAQPPTRPDSARRPNTWQPGMRLALLSRRYVLRSTAAQGVTERYRSWWNDAEIMAGLNRKPRNWSMDDCIRHVLSFNNRNNFHLGIHRKSDGEMIGFISLMATIKNRTAKSNIVVDKEFWGEGVVKEVRARVMQFAFNRLKTLKYKGMVVGRNYPSIYNYLSMGFTCEGVFKAETAAVDGGRADIFHFAMFREDWAERVKQQREEQGADAGKDDPAPGG